jgi:hypothetical protein
VTAAGIPATASAGWLGRDGRFWPCDEWQHESSGRDIVRELGFQTGGMPPKDYPMLRRHWTVVYIDGSTLGTSKPFNQAQMDTMFDLAQRHSLMRRELMGPWHRDAPRPRQSCTPVAEVDRLRQELVNQREQRREWAYRRSQATLGAAVWNEASADSLSRWTRMPGR